MEVRQQNKAMNDERRQRIIAAILRHPDEANWKIAKRIYKGTSAEVQSARDSMGGNEAQTVDPGIDGIIIGQRRVMPQKPQGSDCRRRIREIKKGVCHRVPQFAAHLGISEDTLRKHARAMACLKWVEMTPDNFEEAVMNPDTAKQYFR